MVFITLLSDKVQLVYLLSVLTTIFLQEIYIKNHRIEVILLDENIETNIKYNDKSNRTLYFLNKMLSYNMETNLIEHKKQLSKNFEVLKLLLYQVMYLQKMIFYSIEYLLFMLLITSSTFFALYFPISNSNSALLL